MKHRPGIWLILSLVLAVVAILYKIESGGSGYSLTVVEWDPDTRRAVFVLKNETLTFPTYTGYGILWFGTPIYSIQIISGSEWTYKPSALCGTGLGKRVLFPGTSVKFEASLEDKPSRVEVKLDVGTFTPHRISLYSQSFDSVGI